MFQMRKLRPSSKLDVGNDAHTVFFFSSRSQGWWGTDVLAPALFYSTRRLPVCVSWVLAEGSPHLGREGLVHGMASSRAHQIPKRGFQGWLQRKLPPGSGERHWRSPADMGMFVGKGRDPGCVTRNRADVCTSVPPRVHLWLHAFLVNREQIPGMYSPPPCCAPLSAPCCVGLSPLQRTSLVPTPPFPLLDYL